MAAIMASTPPYMARLLLYFISGLFVIYCCIILLIENTKFFLDKSFQKKEPTLNSLSNLPELTNQLTVESADKSTGKEYVCSKD
ncbi:unnamed protein product [Cylicocyclus nassatus]|uniref:Uncharacterized protein n=1 Tax=Cylicocyclus nassatus TaxID=53992 RepID=A0AA36DNW4_CYLNA|nr:unnamed protein product [Cylicocyclus nassatus]